ncbi:MAG: DUF1232 domain-containing protein [Desulfofustis sp.]|nr:DUF1232 domain-containing protein [Desulfofustis sp.]MBT8354770.1 DUF1232 domain-containing protein [Desulfofustis sp.]NNF47521.1 DUF1232 domain-containing protein [Desulfofustis sp.]NNK57709.1 DUF1232 domain-containing protein [Desulfofustis sp.]RZW26135.1 MAG: DUF1232 domain-containing protein [Desulfobulbaceae bacterium]
MAKRTGPPVLGRLLSTTAGYLRLLLRKDTPWKVKLILLAALIYLVLPYDLMPDWFLGIGIVDDLAVVSLLVWLAIRLLGKDPEGTEKYSQES